MRRISAYEIDKDRPAAVLALTLLRVGIGAIFVAHGWQKLHDVAGFTAAFARDGIPQPHTSVYLAIAGEFLGGLGLLLGALTRVAALGPVLVMAGAIYFVHRDNGLFGQNGGWEYPLTLLLISLYFVAHGGGPLSLDALAHRRPRTVRRRHHVEAITHP